QVALSLVLLTGASLLVRSLDNLMDVPTGLDRDHLAIIDVDARARGYTGDRLETFTREVSARLGQVPGVAAVTWSENGIFSGTEGGSSFQVPGFTAKAEDDTTAAYDLVGPGYVSALGAQLLRGREFTAADFAGPSTAVMVNQTFARFFFGETDPIGRTIQLNDSSTVQIVGVVGDIRDHELTGEMQRRFYLPGIRGASGDPTALSFEVRTVGDPARLLPQLRAAVLAVDPLLPIEDANALSVLMQQSVGGERLLARLATGFGLLALLLASIGLYGVMSYAVTRRTGELGLRAALGASRGQVLRQVMAGALRLVGLGVVVGVPLALGAAQLLKSQLHGLGAVDVPSLSIALAILGCSAVAAAAVPALRASRVSPLVALQQE
ncbi:MAG: ABC transporter permease, partial [Gemmatimonadetes bacterium]|nr:ABC transporter permease [Gemmatimonadota bacterium]